MPHLIVVRHGESEFNNSSRFCGWIDAELTEKGVSQAQSTGELIKTHPLTRDLDFNFCVTSRLKRAIKTSNVILEHLNRLDMDMVKTWRLNERHYGKLQGLVKNDVLKSYGKDQYMYWRRAYAGLPPPADTNSEFYKDTLKIGKFDDDLTDLDLPKSESLELVIKRLKPFWENEILVELNKGKNVLCVTHGSVVRALLTILFDLSKEDVETLNVPNGIPILIDFEDENHWHPNEWVYLDPKRAQLEAERVRLDGLNPI